MQGCLATLGIFISLFSVTMIWVFAKWFALETLWPVYTFFSITGIGGIYLTVSNIIKKLRKTKETREKEILRIIMQKGGKITPIELASSTQLSIDDAEITLKDMCNKGRGQVELTESGELVYVFRGVISEYEKIKTKNILDI